MRIKTKKLSWRTKYLRLQKEYGVWLDRHQAWMIGYCSGKAEQTIKESLDKSLFSHQEYKIPVKIKKDEGTLDS